MKLVIEWGNNRITTRDEDEAMAIVRVVRGDVWMTADDGVSVVQRRYNGGEQMEEHTISYNLTNGWTAEWEGHNLMINGPDESFLLGPDQVVMLKGLLS